MIQKNRLEELIKQGATIYCPYYIYYDGVELDNKDYVDDEFLYIFRQVWKKESGYDKFPFKCLFETKEDAEFAKEFQNITRTETLNLPTWEMFIKLGIPFEFTSKNGECFYLEICNEERIDKIEIYNKIGFISNVFSALATKENYFEACKIAKKLFLGEQI